MEVAQLAAEAAADKKAGNVVVLDMKDVSSVTDYFVICSASNSIQVRAIADHIEEKLESIKSKRFHREGYDGARWILLDFGDVVVHVFHDQERDFYNLERLWGDAAIVNLA
ncbi:MAG: ribosome silencing factor [Actinobacteria bacterium]|nr:ribosome silencing factor [Actinomycetota bacterium]